MEIYLKPALILKRDIGVFKMRGGASNIGEEADFVLKCHSHFLFISKYFSLVDSFKHINCQKDEISNNTLNFLSGKLATVKDYSLEF